MIYDIFHPIDALMKRVEAIKKIGGWVADKLGFGDDDDSQDSEATPAPVPQATPYTPTPQLQQVYTPYTPAPQQGQKSSAEVVVKFDNMPKGAQVETVSSTGQTDLGVEYGYAMGGA